MINTKVQELIHELLGTIKKRFPEVELLSVTESPENSNDLWINVTAPEDEDREIELMVSIRKLLNLKEFTSDKEADILVGCRAICQIALLSTANLSTLRNVDFRKSTLRYTQCRLYNCEGEEHASIQL